MASKLLSLIILLTLSISCRTTSEESNVKLTVSEKAYRIESATRGSASIAYALIFLQIVSVMLFVVAYALKTAINTKHSLNCQENAFIIVLIFGFIVGFPLSIFWWVAVRGCYRKRMYILTINFRLLAVRLRANGNPNHIGSNNIVYNNNVIINPHQMNYNNQYGQNMPNMYNNMNGNQYSNYPNNQNINYNMVNNPAYVNNNGYVNNRYINHNNMILDNQAYTNNMVPNNNVVYSNNNMAHINNMGHSNHNSMPRSDGDHANNLNMHRNNANIPQAIADDIPQAIVDDINAAPLR